MTGLEYLIYAVVMMVVSYAITIPMQPKPQNAIAGRLDVPTATAGDNIPVVFGTVLIKQVNIIDYGDARTTPIKTKSGK